MSYVAAYVLRHFPVISDLISPHPHAEGINSSRTALHLETEALNVACYWKLY